MNWFSFNVRLLVIVMLMLIMWLAPVSAQSLPDQIKRLEDQNTRQAADIAAVKDDVVSIKARLAALEGTKVAVGSLASLVQPAAGPVSPLTYDAAYQQAIASRVPLVVGVGHMPPSGYAYVACISPETATFRTGTITVCLPDGTGGMYVSMRLPGTATAVQIQQCVTSCILGAASCGGATCNCVALMGACTCGPPVLTTQGSYQQPVIYSTPMQSGIFRGGLLGGRRGGMVCGPNGCGG